MSNETTVSSSRELSHPEQHADVVIVGAGLAGLAAAHELRDLSVIVLEQESRAGGRVLTVPNAFSAVDLGACFAVNPEVFPAGTIL